MGVWCKPETQPRSGICQPPSRSHRVLGWLSRDFGSCTSHHMLHPRPLIIKVATQHVDRSQVPSQAQAKGPHTAPGASVCMRRSSVGLNTRAGVARFVGSLTTRMGPSMRPQTGALMKVSSGDALLGTWTHGAPQELVTIAFVRKAGGCEPAGQSLAHLRVRDAILHAGCSCGLESDFGCAAGPLSDPARHHQRRGGPV